MLTFALRLAMLSVIVLAYMARARPPTDAAALRRTVLRTSRWSRRCCRVLGFRVPGRTGLRGRGGRMLALNHLSWVDPLLISAFQPAVFVTSAETGEHPLLGRICASAGCVFMERRRRRGLGAEGQQLAGLMRQFTVVVFPEATSSNGSTVLPFKPATFAAALDASVPIELFMLRYLRIGGARITPRNRDRVCWHGDMDFFPHLLGLLAIPRLEAALRPLGAIATGRDEDRKSVARRAHGMVAAALHQAVA